MRIFLAVLCIGLLAACSPTDVLHLLARQPAAAPASEVIVLTADSTDAAALNTAADIITRRLELLGVPAEVAVTGSAEITITSHLIDSSAGDLLALVTQRGSVEFADLRNAPPLLLANPANTLLATSANPATGGEIDPTTTAPYATIIDAITVIDAQASVSQYSGAWEILLRFAPDDGALLSEYTGANLGTAVGILIDGRLLIAPVIQAQIGSEVLIAGNFTADEARRLAAIIGGGVLPVALTAAASS